MRRALIDTNIYSLAMRGDVDVADRLRQLDELALSVISLGELIAGFRGGAREADNRAVLARFLDSPRVTLLAVDAETADAYGGIVGTLKSAGTPIPTNDIWIAATAQRHGLPVYTRDAHFNFVPGLQLVGYQLAIGPARGHPRTACPASLLRLTTLVGASPLGNRHHGPAWRGQDHRLQCPGAGTRGGRRLHRRVLTTEPGGRQSAGRAPRAPPRPLPTA